MVGGAESGAEAVLQGRGAHRKAPQDEANFRVQTLYCGPIGSRSVVTSASMKYSASPSASVRLDERPGAEHAAPWSQTNIPESFLEEEAKAVAE